MRNTKDLNTIAERYTPYGVTKEELTNFVERGIAKGYNEKTLLFMIDKVFFLVFVKEKDIEAVETLKYLQEIQYEKDYINFINGEYLECDLVQEDVKEIQEKIWEEDYNNFINGEYLECGLSQEEIQEIQESI